MGTDGPSIDAEVERQEGEEETGRWVERRKPEM